MLTNEMEDLGADVTATTTATISSGTVVAKSALYPVISNDDDIKVEENLNTLNTSNITSAVIVKEERQDKFVENMEDIDENGQQQQKQNDYYDDNVKTDQVKKENADNDDKRDEIGEEEEEGEEEFPVEKIVSDGEDEEVSHYPSS